MLLVDLLDELHGVEHVVIVRLERKLLMKIMAHRTAFELIFREHGCAQLLVIIVLKLERVHNDHMIVVECRLDVLQQRLLFARCGIYGQK